MELQTPASNITEIPIWLIGAVHLRYNLVLCRCLHVASGTGRHLAVQWFSVLSRYFGCTDFSFAVLQHAGLTWGIASLIAQAAQP